MPLLLPRALGSSAPVAASGKCRAAAGSSSIAACRPVVAPHIHQQQQQQHARRHAPCCQAAPAEDAAAAATDADATAEAARQRRQQQLQQQVPVQDLEQQQQQEAAASSSINSVGLPPGPMEPPNEEPKKLSAAARLSEELTSTSITIFGDDTDLNWAVCQALSKKLGWFPVSTRKVLLGLQKAESLEELVAREGREAVVASEAKMLKGMRDQLRCCVATIGDGAAADPALYTDLYGSILIWLDEEDKRAPKPPSPLRALYQQQAEVRGKVAVRKGGFGQKEQGAEDKAATVASQLIKAMLQLLKTNKDLLARKRLYIEFGCRGDWPNLMPEEWNPVLDGLDRKEVA